MQVIETKGGGKLIGRMVSIDADSVQIQTRFSKTEIPIQAIKKIRRIPESSMRDKKYWYPDLNNRKECVFSGTARRQQQVSEGRH